MPYATLQSADPGTARAAADYLFWFLPALALQFALQAMDTDLPYQLFLALPYLLTLAALMFAVMLLFLWMAPSKDACAARRAATRSVTGREEIQAPTVEPLIASLQPIGVFMR